MDLLLDLIRLIRPQATLWGRSAAAGRWGHSFRQRDRLQFGWVQEGECLLVRLGFAAVRLQKNDFVLFRTCTPVTFTSDPTVEPVDSEDEAANGRLGDGTENPVIMRGGRFVLDSVNEHLLMDLIPPLVHIKAADALSWKMRSLIQLNEAEASQPGPGSDFIIVRLMELLLIEIIRSEALQECRKQAGLLAGLADPVTERALSAIHMDVARNWTVADLARISGVSRSGFAARFCRVVGTGPIEYLINWRMAIARDELRRGTLNVGEIGLRIGFQSSSAFSKAFTRSVGCSPKLFADRYVTSRDGAMAGPRSRTGIVVAPKSNHIATSHRWIS